MEGVGIVSGERRRGERRRGERRMGERRMGERRREERRREERRGKWYSMCVNCSLSLSCSYCLLQQSVPKLNKCQLYRN